MNEPLTLVYADFGSLLHGVFKPDQGDRFAIIPYANKEICHFQTLERTLQGTTDEERFAYFSSIILPFIAKHLSENAANVLSGFIETRRTSSAASLRPRPR